ncbi:family 65 glycosyl hydrolase domain-containing protein [Agarilytica rhodophyticola]|uniref:family 65 glycosyl hydrolase domain-containing protein n=1 Tax=Agarilytica rhodophyticola TaxID=1737490 RepID=UPI000B345981|nr:family 65 glycosyl hydrolase domain-containing protein [Agarilytica rhodophyticola]
MKNYIQHDPWKIIENDFDPAVNRVSESIFSIGNGKFGQRANFEESYSGDSLRGSYVAGVYYPDPTRVGWWKNGYPDYFAKVINSTNWIGIDVCIDGEQLDLAKCEIESFSRTLNMKEGYLLRRFVVSLASGKRVEVVAKRFVSIVDTDNGAIKYSVKLLNFSGTVEFSPYLDLDIFNSDSNYDEKFWQQKSHYVEPGLAYICGETLKTGFTLGVAMNYQLVCGDSEVVSTPELIEKDKYVANKVSATLAEGEEVTFYKYAAIISSLNCPVSDIEGFAKQSVADAKGKGFETMLAQHAAAWADKWSTADIRIEGDIAAQQGIRFNIFHMNQTYTGEDERLNIGPKGFTGEKYGGVTYWDTEAYGVPFYLKTADPKVARQLLIYRYHHLENAIKNAEKLGFNSGAALYPMVTINGEECHNEWEITFEEIHRNGAIAYAIYNYINHTGDEAYLAEYGLEVLIGISRFWCQRVQWSKRRNAYLMLGVTGPNEYENNVNNNWYTNYIARWTMQYTQQALAIVKQLDGQRYQQIIAKTKLNAKEDETSVWSDICEKIALPVDDETGVFIQHDGFMDKDLQPMSAIPKEQYPIHQHWSWDRILRSCYIKQADVMQGIYLFENEFERDTIKKNYDFYEPLTVHESSLSPCIHSILASSLGYQDLAYKFYLRTSRLDLDDYNNDTSDGLHITSMAGTWMSIVEGFGGVRVDNGVLSLKPFIPENWDSYAFKMIFRGVKLNIMVSNNDIIVENESENACELNLYGEMKKILPKSKVQQEINY